MEITNLITKLALLDTINKLKPYYIVEIGCSSLLASLANDIVQVLEVSMVPSELNIGGGSYSTIGRSLNEDDRDYLSKIGVSERRIIEHTFTSDLVVSEHKYDKNNFGFSEDDFVLLLIGGRIQLEMDSVFLSWLNDMVTYDRIKVLVIGPYDSIQETKTKYHNFEGKIRFTGFVSNIMDVVPVGDLYINPIRIGGGTSCVEAMSVGIPILTTNYGDVAVNCGEEFWTETYDTMKEMVLKYRDDKIFYNQQSEKAQIRAERLLNTEGEFQSVLKKFYELENME